MKNYRLLILPIIISGILHWIIVKSDTLNFSEMITYLIINLTIFIGCIIWFNKLMLQDIKKSFTDNNTNSKKAIKIPQMDFNKRYYLKVFIGWLLVGIYLGFKFKKLTDSYILNKASKKSTEWQKDLYLQSQTATDPFFSLKGYSFNWELFLISFLVVFGTAYFIRNTIYYDKIESYFNSIKREKS